MLLKKIAPVLVGFLFTMAGKAQLVVTPNNIAEELAQRIAGDGVSVSNAVLKGAPLMTAFFTNTGNTQINIDSGILLTNGRAKSLRLPNLGVDGYGTERAINMLADNSWGRAGDPDLADAIHVDIDDAYDACILEFDFVPLGDRVQFNYVFSSEEYDEEYVCDFNDAFAFFISGPGISGMQNIALIPNTNIPVSILNVNNVPNVPCNNNINYYVDNTRNFFFTHNGHTVVLQAESGVQPCQTYHLKLVIMDVGDDMYDSGVFVQAKSLVSEVVKIDNHNPLNENDKPYLAEGCHDGLIHITRPQKRPYPQTVNIVAAGTATNGVDVALLPTSVTIPAGDSVVLLPITPLADFVPEGNETLKLYITTTCIASAVFADSIEIELRDIDRLTITPADSAVICRNEEVQLIAAAGYTTYQWTPDPAVSDITRPDPYVKPTGPLSYYTCTASYDNCVARDSVLLKWRTIALDDKTDVNCKDGATGMVQVKNENWDSPLFSINNGPYQANPRFTGLPLGSHLVRITDASGCIDSVRTDLIQLYPDIGLSATSQNATCSIAPDGRVDATATGGNGNYTYSLNSGSYQASGSFIAAAGDHIVSVKDGNGCTTTYPVAVSRTNTITMDAGDDATICEGKTFAMLASTNGTAYQWSPLPSLSAATLLQPTASPVVTTQYYLDVTLGSCTKRDSMTIHVRPAPRPLAGDDIDICYGKTVSLTGNGGTTFSWSPAKNMVSAPDRQQIDIEGLETITYYLHVTDMHGCHSLRPDAITVNVTPPLRLFAGNDTTITMGQPLQLQALDQNNSGVTDWQWSPAQDLTNSQIADPVAVFDKPVPSFPYEYSYTVTGTTPEGCRGTDELKIKVISGPEIYVPTAFSPDGNGRNDYLLPIPVGIKQLHYFHVYNRWGQLIYQSKDASRGWDGRVSGVPQPTATYIWMAAGTDYTGKLITRKGTTTLVR